jgi:hypothetical protein
VDGHSRTDRASEVTLLLVGVVVLAMAVVTAAEIPSYLDQAAQEPAAGTHAFTLLFLNAIPLALAGLLTFLVAQRLRRGRPGARSMALAWVATAAVTLAVGLTTFGGALWALRIVIFQPGGWLVRWPYFYERPRPEVDVVEPPVETWVSDRMDDLAFWFPGILAVGVLLLLGLLLAGWFAGRARAAHPG